MLRCRRMGPRSRNSTTIAASRTRSVDLIAAASPSRLAALSAQLAASWPDAVVELDHTSAYQLLVATILAAQSTDKLINTVTPALFARYPTPGALARADPAELEAMIYSTGFYRMKAKHLIGMAQQIVERHAGEVPDTMEQLVALPGVARKTANVVLGSVFGKNEGVVVDTHVARLAPRLGLTAHSEPAKIEQDLMAAVPRDQWSVFAHRLIWHGRRVCHARQPDCEHCTLAPLCPSAGLGGAAGTRGPDAGPALRPTQAHGVAAAKTRTKTKTGPPARPSRAAPAGPTKASARRAARLAQSGGSAGAPAKPTKAAARAARGRRP
jgi:endonuclease III